MIGLCEVDALLLPDGEVPFMNDIESGGSLTGLKELDWFRSYFRPHFDDWIFGPINRLVCSSEDALIGFVFMACAIDYLAGFWWGKSTKRHSKDAYIGFIDEYFPKGQYDAHGLYDSLRNGLVHMFTIKGKKYALVDKLHGFHLQVSEEGQIILNAEDFRDDLLEAKEKYFDEVEARHDLLDKWWERYNREGFLDKAPFDLQSR